MVKQKNLPILEYAMQQCDRASVSSMQTGNNNRVRPIRLPHVGLFGSPDAMPLTVGESFHQRDMFDT